ncbi:hypothetical protein ABZ387_31665 [Streptomyces flaveolus]|uniref:hypothetical protein n=1 Tax=Streptomyces flaveolus TaxID=67297 RepID=UPI0033C329BF
MTTFSSTDGNSQDFPVPDRSDSIEDRLQTARMRLIRCREDLADTCREVRGLRREKRRAHRRELRAKAGPRLVTSFSVTLAITGSAAFAIAVVLLTMGELSKAKDVLAFAGVAWGGAAAIRTRRK